MKIGVADQENVEFMDLKHKLDDLLVLLNSVNSLECDSELEAYLLFHKDLMPNLKEINGVRRSLTSERWVEKKILHVMNNIWMHTNCYRIATSK
jgi:hypothetical protein